jgi:hypothetical protein
MSVAARADGGETTTDNPTVEAAVTVWTKNARREFATAAAPSAPAEAEAKANGMVDAS